MDSDVPSSAEPTTDPVNVGDSEESSSPQKQATDDVAPVSGDTEAPVEETSPAENSGTEDVPKPTDPRDEDTKEVAHSASNKEQIEDSPAEKEVNETSSDSHITLTRSPEKDTVATVPSSDVVASPSEPPENQTQDDFEPKLAEIPKTSDEIPTDSTSQDQQAVETESPREATQISGAEASSDVSTHEQTEVKPTAEEPLDNTAVDTAKKNGGDSLENIDNKFVTPEDAQPEDFLPTKEPQEIKTPRFVYILSALATIGGFLFGYDIGIVAGSMLFIQPYFELSTFWQEAIVSGTIAAAAVAALISGWLTDKIGRKLTIMTSSVVFTAGGVLMAAAPTKEVLLAGRVVAGLGVGMASVVVPVYVAESAPVHIRGRLVSFHQLLINTGIITSSLLAGAFSYVVPEGWRFMLGMAAVPGVLQFIGFLFMPESPRWLVGRGRIEWAKKVLQRMRGVDDVDEELNDIIVTVVEAQKESAGGIQHWIKIFRTPHVRRALFVGCALLFFQQWCGINTVIYYSGTVLKMAGFPVKYAIWLVTVPNMMNFGASFIGIYLVEKIGRRPLLILSLAGTLIGLIILAVGFQLAAENPAHLNGTIVEQYDNGTVIDECTTTYSSCLACVKDNSCGYCYTSETDGTCLPSVDEERSSIGRCNASSSTETFYKWAYEYCPSDFTWIAIFGMAVFVFAFAPGLGPMPWTINSEIYPLWARSTCNSLAACTAWVCNLIISFTFLTMTEHITIHGTFWLFAAITVLGVIFMVIMLPETKNKTLEEMERMFMSSRNWQEVLNKRMKQKESGAETIKLEDKQP